LFLLLKSVEVRWLTLRVAIVWVPLDMSLIHSIVAHVPWLHEVLVVHEGLLMVVNLLLRLEETLVSTKSRLMIRSLDWSVRSIELFDVVHVKATFF